MIKQLCDQTKAADLLIYVTGSRGGDVATKINGQFAIDKIKFPFKAIAFGRIGGHNIHLKLSQKTIRGLKKNGYDSESISLEIQRKLLEGDVIMPVSFNRRPLTDES